MRGHELLSELCFCHLKAIIVSNNGIVSEAYEKIWETCMPRGELKHSYWFFPETPNVAWIVSVI